MRKFFTIAIVTSVMLSQLSGAIPLPGIGNDAAINAMPHGITAQQIKDIPSDNQGDMKTLHTDPFTYLQSIATPHLLAFHGRNICIYITSLVLWLIDRKHPYWRPLFF